MTQPRRVLIVGFEGAQLLDVAGPYALLGMANDLDAKLAYEIEFVASRRGSLETSAGLILRTRRSIADMGDADLAGLHTLMVTGGEGIYAAYQDEALVAFIARAAARAKRVTSVCSGAFLLARAGVLSGRRAATHWAATREFRTRHPETELEENALFVRDGHIWTSAGVTAGMDMTLALIEEDLGREAALKIAQRAVMFMMRPGGQSQFSTILGTQGCDQGRLGDLIAWMRDHPDTDLSVPALAARAKMSERTFARVFNAEAGDTPARFVERLRVDAARAALTGTDRSVAQIAGAAGFGSGEQMRRAFQRHLGVAPAEFRARFSGAPDRRIEA